tara:strand:+ start:323 stop:448 length:126 start_codon:yes stop_codon:yes gene_type:complete
MVISSWINQLFGMNLFDEEIIDLDLPYLNSIIIETLSKIIR